jgi:N-acetylmuramoyl-L-alanine amidase
MQTKQTTNLVITDITLQLPRHPTDPNYRTRPMSAITKIVVHYDAVAVPPPKDGALGYDPIARYISQAKYHMGKNWNEGRGPIVRGFGLMYHYRVSADGRLWRTQPDNLVTWHARNANYAGLAVCCDLGPGQQPTQAQLVGLNALLHHLCYERPDFPASRPDVWGHGELTDAGNHTPCPAALTPWVREYRRGK